MPAVSGDGLEKLEDMIVRAAESSADHIRTAKASARSYSARKR
jgi:hypothetical protein